MVDDAQRQDKNKREESWYFVRTICIYSGKICRVSVLLGEEVKTLQGKYIYLYLYSPYMAKHVLFKLLRRENKFRKKYVNKRNWIWQIDHENMLKEVNQSFMQVGPKFLLWTILLRSSCFVFSLHSYLGLSLGTHRKAREYNYGKKGHCR